MSKSIIPIEQIGTTINESPAFITPDPATIFALRAKRFAQLAEGHTLGEWLRFLSHVSQAQHEALKNFPVATLPGAAALQRANEHGMPPLPAQSWPRMPAWREALGQILNSVSKHAPEPGQIAIQRLLQADDVALESMANTILKLEICDDIAAQPFVAAALQVYWTHLAASLGNLGLAKLDIPGVCPCCGSPPVASVVKIGVELANLRYLHCSLCNTEWHLARVHCSACNEDQSLTYQSIEGGKQIAKAEACDGCKSYLKIFYEDKDPLADPVADDLASLGLDLLVDEAGYSRSGPNLLLVTAVS